MRVCGPGGSQAGRRPLRVKEQTVHSGWATLGLQGLRDNLHLTLDKTGYYRGQCKQGGTTVVQREKLEHEKKEVKAQTLGTPTLEGKGQHGDKKVLWAEMCLPPNLDVEASEWDPIWR